MGYVSKRGRRPDEYASKSSHGYIIKDSYVEDFLHSCNLPKYADEVKFSGHEVVKLEEIKENPIKNIIAIDGGYTEVSVRKEFPSAKICFFQFGALIFSVADLEEIADKPFIDPEDIAKLKNIQRYKLAIPTKNINIKGETSLIGSVRKTIYDFFSKDVDGDKFIETLKWFIFEEYDKGLLSWNLATCPCCDRINIELSRKEIKPDFTFNCPNCKNKIYLTDVFRLHEAIDNELGAGGILGYLTTLLEQVVLIHLIKIILKTKPALLKDILFIKDGPLAFFGQTANMHKPMRRLVNYLFSKHGLFLAGLEKSGSFVEHADEISKKLETDDILIVDNEYIYKYILPGKADSTSPYGRTTYYGNKIIFKSHDDKIYVISLPTKDVLLNPKKPDFKNIDSILFNIKKLKCDMYDSSLVPITLVNKLVSLANHPSSVILEKFAKKSIS